MGAGARPAAAAAQCRTPARGPRAAGRRRAERRWRGAAVHGRRRRALPAPVPAAGLRRRDGAEAGRRAALSRRRTHPRLGDRGSRGSAPAPRGASSCSPATSASRAGRCSPTRRRSPDADVLVVESTYGNRLHKTSRRPTTNSPACSRATLPRGNVVIPAFAVGRTQEVLYVLADLVRLGRAPGADDLRRLAARHRARPRSPRATPRRSIARAATSPRGRRSTATACASVFTETAQDSMAINEIRAGAVIVAASGMCDAGRIKHHLRHNLPRPECAIVFTGFQAGGTLGRQIVDGATQVRLFRRGRAGARVASTPSAACRRTATRRRCWAGWAASGNRRRAPSSSTASATRRSASRRSSASACTGRRSRYRRAATGCASPDRRAASRAVIRRSRDNPNFALPSRLP